MSSQLLDKLSSIFDKKAQDYINLSELKNKEHATQLSKILDINIKKHSNGELMNIIKPLLPLEYSFKTKGKSIYLLRKTIPDIIYSYAKKHSSLTLNQIAPNLKFLYKDEFAISVNTLIQNRQIEISIILQSKGFGCKIIPFDHYKSINDTEEVTVEPVLTPLSHSPENKLKSAYLKLLKGRSYVKIFELRRYVNWSKNQFDSAIQKLWDDKIIELQESNPALLSDDEKRDSYRDKNNGLRILLIWRK